MTANSPQYNIKHPSKADLECVFQFMLACDVAEYGEEDTDINDLLDQWKETDLSTDGWISIAPDGILNGYTLLTTDSESACTVDFYTNPSTRLQGLADTLLDLAVERFQTLVQEGKIAKNSSLTLYANGKNPVTCALVQSRGFQEEIRHYRMQLDFSAPYPAPIWPQGYDLAAFKEGDEKELYELIMAAFNWPGHKTIPFATWKKYVFRGGRFDPQFFVLVRQGGRLVGAALCYNEEVLGWIKQLAITEELRGKGLGSLLLKHMFSVFSQKGLPTVALGVASTNPSAVSFYERSGMHRTREFVEYHRQA